MKRSEFIKQVLGLGALAAMPVSLAKEYEKIYLLQCFVRGFQYYEGPKLIDEMNSSNKVIELRRESSNEHDKYAIALYFQNQKIGYIPRESNKMISRLMAAQILEFHAEITHVEAKASAWENVRLAVYVLKEKDLSQNATPLALTTIKTPKYKTLHKEDVRIEM